MDEISFKGRREYTQKEKQNLPETIYTCMEESVVAAGAGNAVAVSRPSSSSRATEPEGTRPSWT